VTKHNFNSSSMALMQGRTAVITGTARAAGIGQACAKILYQNGYNVVGIDYAQHEFAADAPWDTAAAPEAAAAGQRCAWLQLDLSKPEQVLSVREHIQQLGFNAVAVLVNNAGIADPYMQSDSLAERAALWQKYISTNLTAPFLLSEALLPIMEQGAGSIIHVSSTRALQSEPHSEVSCQACSTKQVACRNKLMNQAGTRQHMRSGGCTSVAPTSQ
jgi:NAD(P)-dependent dehydrogenase (short-subunit alcohol dehydrogenase family)